MMRAAITSIVVVACASRVAAFWRMPCRSTTGIGRIDPIVAPGQINDHVHMAFGSGSFGMTADYDSLTSSPCTSCEVTEDKSAYWTPPIYFQYDNGTTVMVPDVGGMLAYYLPYLSNITAFPEGFRMVAGNPFYRNFTGPFPDAPLSSWNTYPSDQFFLQQRAIGFNCLNYAKTPEPSLYRHVLPPKDYMDSECTDGIRLEMAFPSCWNGQLDSVDHRSHVLYPSLVKEGNCPDGYDQHLPFLFYETIFATHNFAGEQGQFVLSPGDPIGTGYHADFMMGWTSSEYLQNALDTCTNPSGEISDCPLFTIQDDSVGAQCTFDMPKELERDNVQGPRDGMPVDVPIQSGPAPATMYNIAGRTGIPTSTLVQSGSQLFTGLLNLPTLGYTPAVPSLTSTALGGIVVAAKSSGVSVSEPTSIGGKDKSHETSGLSATAPKPTTTAAAPSSDSNVVSTTWMTTGSSVVEMVVEETQVTVTASATAGVDMRNKRHLHHHLHQHL